MSRAEPKHVILNLATAGLLVVGLLWRIHAAVPVARAEPGTLFASTTDNGVMPPVHPATQPILWAQVNADGFGDVHNRAAQSLTAFGDYYAGTNNVTTSTVVWRTNGVVLSNLYLPLILR